MLVLFNWGGEPGGLQLSVWGVSGPPQSAHKRLPSPGIAPELMVCGHGGDETHPPLVALEPSFCCPGEGLERTRRPHQDAFSHCSVNPSL